MIIVNKKKSILLLVCFLIFGNSFAQLPFQNPGLSPQERAQDLISRLTLDEKASLMFDQSPAIPRLGIKKFNWWSEALHGLANNDSVTVCPEPIGMANKWHTFPSRIPYNVESGKKYTIEIKYAQMNNCQANIEFDFGKEVDIDFSGLINEFKSIDVVIFAGSISSLLEGEEMPVSYPGFKGGDRTDIPLPEIQRNCVTALKTSRREKRKIIKFDFLPGGVKYKLTLIADGKHDKAFDTKYMVVDNSSSTEVKLLRRGGFAASLTPVE